MYKSFSNSFSCDDSYRPQDKPIPTSEVDPGLSQFLSRFGGRSFGGGIYRVIRGEAVSDWGRTVASAFPAFDQRIMCFAYDWLGRVFALDVARIEDGRPGVVMFEPGTGEAFELPCNLTTFHEVELILHQEEALALSFKKKWLDFGGMNPSYDECIGYKVPLFLGGKDTIDNLHRTDLDVYWSLAVQLIEKTRGLPPGTSIESVRIDG